MRVQFQQNPFDVFIGRPSKWGNPFPIRKDRSRERAVELYETWIRKKPELLADLPELYDKVLGCYCEENQLCHGDILLKLINENFSIKNCAYPVETAFVVKGPNDKYIWNWNLNYEWVEDIRCARLYSTLNYAKSRCSDIVANSTLLSDVDFRYVTVYVQETLFESSNSLYAIKNAVSFFNHNYLVYSYPSFHWCGELNGCRLSLNKKSALDSIECYEKNAFNQLYSNYKLKPVPVLFKLDNKTTQMELFNE